MTTKQQDAVDDMGMGPKRDYGTPPKALDLGIQDTADLAVALARIESVAGLAKANARAAYVRGDNAENRRWLDVLIVLGVS